MKIPKIDFRRELLFVFLSATYLTVLFYRHPIGLNLLLYELVLIFWLLYKGDYKLIGIYACTLLGSLLVTALSVVLVYSGLAIFINLFVLFLLVGYCCYPNSRSLLTSFGIGITNILKSQSTLLRKLRNLKLNGHPVKHILRRSGKFIIPLVIIIIFISIYRISNPVFDDLIIDIGLFFQNISSLLFRNFDGLLIITFLISLSVSSFLVFRNTNKRLTLLDRLQGENLKRRRRKLRRSFRTRSLLNEYKAGVFLLGILNLILVVVNFIDINWVWFGFEWEGQYLKQFVHEGTYLLILSILISIALVLYFFRGNLNFYAHNRLLKILGYLWLAQNAILAVSVATRNFWYIKYFALAYKRIGVIVFLILTLYGLFTVVIKVRSRKSAFYLFRQNSYALVIILVLCTTVNWDKIIARYNFNHSEQSFVHLDYLSTLSDKALPYLDISMERLHSIERIQTQKFPFEKEFMSPEKYYWNIVHRKERFKRKWENKTFFSWNLQEYLAYKRMFDAEAKSE